MEVDSSQQYEGSEIDPYTQEFLEELANQSGFERDCSAASILGYEDENIKVLNEEYSKERSAFNSHLYISVPEKYDDILVYHELRPGHYPNKETLHGAARIAQETGFKLDHDGMGYLRVRPGIVRDDESLEQFVDRLEVFDRAIYRNAIGEDFEDIKRGIKADLGNESRKEKLWREFRNLLS